MNTSRSAKLSLCIARRVFYMLFLCAVFLVSNPLKAQSFYGSLVGTVTDSSGAVVPEATVKVTNTGTNSTQTMQSDSSGKYSFVNLVPANYRVEVTKASFKRFLRESIPVQVGSVVRVDSVLAIGNVSETIEVSTAAPLLQTDSSTLGQTIGGSQVQEMPLNGRNVMNLIALAPGVVPTGASQGDTGINQGTRTAGGAGWGNYQIGGAIQGQSAQFIDGVANNLLVLNIVALVPTQDAIQEFNVASSNAGADFGRFAGGVVNMTTKSGSNSFHGSVWEYFRNAALNANDFFSNRNGSPRAQWNQNQYGAMASGPLKRDKAFFMFTWEGFKAITGNLTPTNVPTQEMQNGIFRNKVTDPLGNCNIVNDPIAKTWTITNLYQGACGDPTNKVIKTFYPLPNSSGTSNWFLTTPIRNNQNQYSGRVDYVISAKHRLFSRYTYWNVLDYPHSEFLQQGLNGTKWPTDNGQAAYYTHQAVLGDTYTLNPTTILDVRLNYVRQTAPNRAQSDTVDESQFGPAYAALSPGMSTHTMPGFNATGLHNLYGMQNYPQPFFNWFNTYGVNANLVKIVRAHSLKFGAEVRLMDSSSLTYGNSSAGTYTYTSTSWAGDEWANFLMGYPTSASFQTTAETAAYSYYQGYYITDTWQATRRLTLNLGLRYELPGAIAERKNRAIVLLPSAVDPTTGITGTEALVNSPLYGGRTTVQPKYNLFAPRVGFAYRLGANTVIRGGYGLSYLPNDLSGVTPFSAYVNSAKTSANVPGSGNPKPLQTILNGFVASGGLKQPSGRSNPNFMTNLGSRTSYFGQNISGPVPYQPYPYVQQWNAAVSHQFRGNLMAEIGYSGLKGTNMPGAGSKSIDELDGQYYSLGSALTTSQPCAKANGLMMTVGQCNRPYPYYNNVQDTAQFYARENYRSLQAKLEKRFGAGGTLNANYTFAKNMGNTDTQNGYLEAKATTQGGSGNGGIQDFNNLDGEYSLISYDVTNRTVVSYVLSLPFGKGKKFANSLGGPMNAVVSGWAVNGITIFQSGFPVFLSTANQNQLQSSFGAGTTRPMVVPGCNAKIGGSGLDRVNAGRWFNTSCFENVGATTTISGVAVPNSVAFSQYQFGNEPRVDPNLRADGPKNFDFSFQKATAIHESANLEFRAEFFNIFNRVQFAPPVAVVGGGNYGNVTYQVNKPRQIQLSMRVNF